MADRRHNTMLAVSLYFGTLAAANATPISYVLHPSISSGGGAVTVSGSFTFDPAGPTLDAVNLMVTGGPQAEPYTVPMSATASQILAAIPSATTMIRIGFAGDLGSEPDPVSFVAFPPSAPDPLPISIGEAIPSALPEPASAGLLAAGLGLVVFLRRTHLRRRQT